MKKYNLLILLCLNLACISKLSSQNNKVILESFNTIEKSNKTMEEANQAFQIIANAPISKKKRKHKINNCENKAGFASLILKNLGFKPINFWIFKEGLIKGEDNKGGLYYDKKRCQCKKSASWGYHVGAGVILNTPEGLDTLIFDPWTYSKLVSLDEWSLSFFRQSSGRTIYIFPVSKNYRFYPTENEKLITDENKWEKFLDKDDNQMYCGLCGITPNSKCSKKRFRKRIKAKRNQILNYLKQNGVELE